MAHIQSVSTWTQNRKVLLLSYILLFETASLAVAQRLTSNPRSRREEFCNGTEVIFTCETRGSDTLAWSGDYFYVGGQIELGNELDPINSTRTSSSNNNTVATLTENYMDGNVRVLVSTLRITASLDAHRGLVRCRRYNSRNGARIDFQVIGPPTVRDIVTFQLEHAAQDMCAIATILRSPPNAAQADATNYTVRVDGSRVPYRKKELIFTNGTRHPTLLYNSHCGAHRIKISAMNMCGPRSHTADIMLHAEQRLVFGVNPTLVPNVNPPSCNNDAYFTQNRHCTLIVIALYTRLYRLTEINLVDVTSCQLFFVTFRYSCDDSHCGRVVCITLEMLFYLDNYATPDRIPILDPLETTPYTYTINHT